MFSRIKDFFNVISGKAERDYLKSIAQDNIEECLYFEKLGREKRENEKTIKKEIGEKNE